LPALRAALGELVHAVAAYGTFNMMLSDGTALFAHCSTKLSYVVRQYPFVTARLSDEDLSVDFSQVTTPNDRVAIIVTEPLTTNETWTAISRPENCWCSSTAPRLRAIFRDFLALSIFLAKK
jgi:predicted glutamine amidotransferase